MFRASAKHCVSTSRRVRFGVRAEAHQAKTPSKVAIFVEPSPFSHISGMKNRFECLIRGLRDSGDEVLVVTPDRSPPKEFCGAQVLNVFGFPLPFYKSSTLLLSTAISVRVLYHLWRQRPDVIHVSSPGIMVFAVALYARLLAVPLVVSYHTHVPEYIPKYTWNGLVEPMWAVIRFCNRLADLTLVTSKAMKAELEKNRCRSSTIEVWQRGVDTDMFNPKHRSAFMRMRMSDGEPDRPLLAYVGRLGAEKNLKVLKEVLLANPGARLAFVGDGPDRQQLEEHFKGLPVKFMGVMRGQELSEAYASADVFVMPSETETLGFVVMEAMASGLPVVAVAAGGLTDVITRPGQTGLLYPQGDIAQAGRLVGEVISNEALCSQLGEAARQEVLKWGWAAATQKLRTSQYVRAIKNNHSKRRFYWLGVRVRLQYWWRALVTAIVNWLYWLMERLDYAHQFRRTSASTC